MLCACSSALVIIVTSGLYAAVAQVPIQVPTQVGVNAGADAGAGKGCCHCLPARTEVCWHTAGELKANSEPPSAKTVVSTMTLCRFVEEAQLP